MEIGLIVIGFLANNGLTFAHQSHIQMVDQRHASRVNGENKMRGKFQNLFNSISNKNDIKTSEIYHTILKKEVGKEQQMFDTLKEELWVAQYRNDYKNRNFPKSSDTDKDIVVINKRETDEMDDHGRDFTSGDKQRDASKSAMVHREDCFRMLYFDSYGVVMSNVIGLESTNKLVSGGVEKEAESIFENAKKVLEKNGSLLELVYAVEFVLANISDTQIVNEVFKKYFQEPYPKKSYKQAKRALPLYAKIEADINATMTIEQLLKNPDDHL